jgi:4-phytase/acid phosphatase
MKNVPQCLSAGRLVLLALLAITMPALMAGVAETTGDLEFAVILTRHGVRSPLSNQQFEAFSREAWPAWTVGPGELTMHGRQQMTLMGRYYLARFIHEGLLTGRADEDVKHVAFRCDNDERTIETARQLGAGLLPGQTIDPHARVSGEVDPLFRTLQASVGHPDYRLGVASVLGRMGGDPARVVEANRAAFDTLERVLLGESGVVPPGKKSLLSLPSAVTGGKGDHTVSLTGPLTTASSIVDVLMLEYAEGMPMERVGWGRLTPERLTQVMALHSLNFELAQGSSYPARAQGSDLASHLIATLQQEATGKADARALADPGQKVVVVVGHDTNISNLGGLLGLNWWVPGTSRNPVLPGGALVFELRRRRSDHQWFVCTYYITQTLEQIRNLTPLSLEQPPAIAPIFVPECSGSPDGYPAPLGQFTALVRRVVDPAFVVESPN